MQSCKRQYDEPSVKNSDNYIYIYFKPNFELKIDYFVRNFSWPSSNNKINKRNLDWSQQFEFWSRTPPISLY